MAYCCPECGEKISENDIFCAYCGISLQTFASASSDSSAAGKPEPAASPPAEPFEKTEVSAADQNVSEPPPAAGNLTDGFEIARSISPADNQTGETIAENKPDYSPSDSFSNSPGEVESSRTEAADPESSPLSGERQASPADAAMPETFEQNRTLYSLEPKLVSVNILDDSAGDGEKAENQSAADSNAALKADNPISAKENEAGHYTSPNIGSSDTDGKKSAKLKPLAEGTILNGRYEIIRKIGGGGMGAVYLASDRNLGGVLRAVKEMVQSYIEDAQQEKAVSDFRRESLLLTSLEHPSIPTIFDYFYDEKECRFYLVMKYISGGDLAARLKSAPEGRIDEKTVTEWAIQIADVLDYLHNRQPPIVYRDLKPSNVMIDGNSGRVMIIDFGIARWVNKEEKGVTAVGTMGYAPPELFSGNVEPRSDIYSLGSTMFHLLTGADPQSNPLLIFDFHKNPRPRQINSRLSDQIEKILVRSVEYNAEQRFRSAAELRETLTAHLENLKKGAATYGAGEAAKLTLAQNQPVFCGFCGQKILVTDLFCPFCGARQPTGAENAVRKPFFAPAKQTARLMVLGTDELDAPQFQLEKENSLVGRRDPMSNIFPEVDLSKFDPQTKISRRHARIWRDGGVYMLEDLGSSNGTILMTGARDTLRLPPRQPHVLSNGDKIRVGDTMLHFFVA